MKQQKHHFFTLVELLAAMFVFSILLTLSMQLFSSARQMWTRSELRTNVGTDARLALDLIQLRLQLLNYSYETPFEISADRSKVYFASAIPQERPEDYSQLRFYSIQRSSAGELLLAIHSDKASSSGKVSDQKATDFSLLFPPYEGQNQAAMTANAQKARNSVTAKLDSVIGDSTDETDRAVLLANVVDFKVKVYDKNLTLQTGSAVYSPPYLMEIELQIMDSSDNYKKYTSSGTGADEKKALEAGNVYVFRRMISLTDYQVME